MARGWESKSVESQMESAVAAKMAPERRSLTPQEMEKQRKHDSLLLSRTRVLHDLHTACNARYRQQLEEALAYLDTELEKLG